jgi:biotin transporter BioY
MGDLDSALDGYRQVRRRATLDAHGLHWLAKFGLATGFAGFTALMAQISIPVPWTPVPLSLVLLGVLLSGTTLGPRWGAASMGLYLLAGVSGLHVFAASGNAFNPPSVWAPERWRVLVPDPVAQTGFTAGYLLGFPLASAFAGWALRRRGERADGKVFWAVVCALVLLLGGIAVGGLFLRGSGSFAAAGSGDAYDGSLDAAWLFAAAFLVAAPAIGWFVARNRGGAEALNLYLVLLAAVALVHVPGVAVLKATLGWSWSKAFALGSTVFLPFDALKAGVAVLASLPFLPSRSSPAPEA